MSMVKRPTLEQLSEIVASLHMSMSDHEVGDYLEVLEGTMQAYDRVDALPDYLPEVRYPRTPGTRPSAAENPLGAWYVKSEVKGAPYGPLAGKRVVLKDNICLAGVPMMNGASTLEGYVPDVDATVATRILDAGGTIAGKAHCEYFCLSGGSHTSASGPVHNPYKLGYSAGGSSSGCAALVGAGEIEMAIGGDQGGSVRMPGSFSGCYGMKPTHGLVPYTGAMPIEATIDHLGPMTAPSPTTRCCSRSSPGPTGSTRASTTCASTSTPRRSAAASPGLRIGVLTEGFQFESCEPDVVQKVRQAAERLRGLGAIVEEISIPMHVDGLPIWTPIALEGPGRADDARQRHGLQLGGPVHDEPARRACQLAGARQPALAHAQGLDDGRRVLHPPVPRPLLRQGAEPVAPAAQDLRPGVHAARPAADADDADEGDADSRRRTRRSRSTASAPSRCCPTPRPSTSAATRR
jgi:amidase